MASDPQWDLVRELYSSAQRLNREERARYLDEHCSNPEVRKQVEEMFAGRATATISASAAREQLAEGSLLGHYRIGKRLGAGGMGLVYKAVDERLKRTVAIKVIPEHRTDEESRRRFIREAQAASALSHPNIITVYEVGAEGDSEFIALEYIEGRTLREAIGGRGLDPVKAMRYAAQTADALAAAHDAGIVHRDLKPGNVMITARDTVKVLDFGLAKHSAAIAAASGETSLTERGHVVGTVVYMSPEQAEGLPVDARSDIFSFGSLLYEMLTARRPFERQSGVGTMAAILNEEPAPLEQQAPGLPRGLRRLVAKCLQKKPYDRWQNMHDVKLVLQALLEDYSSDEQPLVPPRRTGLRTALWPMVALISALAAVGLATVLLVRPAAKPEAEGVYRLLTTGKGLSDYPAISRDGKFVAYASDHGGQENLDIWLQQIGGQEPIRLTSDAADKSDPAFSPDGAKIAFRSEKDGGGIYVVPALGGDAVLLAPSGRNPRFSPDGRYIAYWTGRGEGSEVAGSGQVFVVEAGGGPPRAVHPEMSVAKYPVWSPNGERLVALGWKDDGVRDWWVLPVDAGAPVKTGFLPDLNRAHFVRSFRAEEEAIDWAEGDVLFAARLGDSANIWQTGLTDSGRSTGLLRRRTSGPGIQVHASRAVAGDTERLAFSDELINYNLWSMAVDPQRGSAHGEMKRVTDNIGTQWAPSLDAEGRHVAYVTAQADDYSVRLKDLNTGVERLLYSNPKGIANARISGDGRTVLAATAASDIVSIPAAGGALKMACSRCGVVTGSSFDGRFAVYEPVKDEDLMLVDTVTQQKYDLAARPDNSVLLTGGKLSRDGKWAAFYAVAYLTRTTRVWIVPVNHSHPVPASEWIAITDGTTFAQDPSWGPNDNVLYFVSERDGFRCYWAQELDPNTKKPVREPFAFQHFHSARRTLRGTSSGGYRVAPTYGGGRVVFSFAEISGNIWLQEKRRAK